jgi:hypothetical protein
MIDIEGPTELVQHSAHRGNLHRRKGTDSHIIDMVSLNIARPTPVGRRGIFYLFKADYLPSQRHENGEGGVM